MKAIRILLLTVIIGIPAALFAQTWPYNEGSFANNTVHIAAANWRPGNVWYMTETNNMLPHEVQNVEATMVSPTTFLTSGPDGADIGQGLIGNRYYVIQWVGEHSLFALSSPSSTLPPSPPNPFPPTAIVSANPRNVLVNQPVTASIVGTRSVTTPAMIVDGGVMAPAGNLIYSNSRANARVTVTETVQKSGLPYYVDSNGNDVLGSDGGYPIAGYYKAGSYQYFAGGPIVGEYLGPTTSTYLDTVTYEVFPDSVSADLSFIPTEPGVYTLGGRVNGLYDANTVTVVVTNPPAADPLHITITGPSQPIRAR